MRYKENFKKGMVRLIISTGISYKKLSELTTISQPTLKKWDDEYRQECMGADSAINMCCLRKEICKAAYRR